MIRTRRCTGPDNRRNYSGSKSHGLLFLGITDTRSRTRPGRARLRAPEGAWRILTRLRLHAGHSTTVLRALLVLTNLEIAR
ncbi:hypothetical protein [Streptomyces sp. NPDC002845]